jgi:ABC-type nitrate/sulfonate/bicarbonate transport system permease component
LGHIVTGPQLTQDILPSVIRAPAGFAISGVVGIAVGLTLGYVRRLGDYCVTVIDFLRSLPAPLFVPLGIVVLGLGSTMVVAIVVSAAVWPVLLNSFDAARRVEPLHLDTARAYGLRRFALFRIVLLPATLPMVFAGLRVALSTSLAVLVVAEMLGAHSGIGFFIQDAQQTFRVPDTYAGVIVLAIDSAADSQRTHQPGHRNGQPSRRGRPGRAVLAVHPVPGVQQDPVPVAVRRQERPAGRP